MESTVEIDDFMHDLAVYSYFYGGGNFFRGMRHEDTKAEEFTTRKSQTSSQSFGIGSTEPRTRPLSGTPRARVVFVQQSEGY